MVDRLQDVPIAIGNVSILPVERDAVISAVLVIETQYARTSGDNELLIERAVPQWLVTILLAIGALLRVAACKCRMSSGMCKVGGDHRIVGVAVNDPGREAAGLESAVLDYPTVTRSRRGRRSRS